MRTFPSIMVLIALTALLIPFQNCGTNVTSAPEIPSSSTSPGPNPGSPGGGPNLNLAPPLRMAPSDLSSLRAAHSGKCLGVRNSQTANGTPLQQEVCTAGANQYFTLRLANGGYNIFDNNSAKCVRIQGASTADGASATLGLCDYYARDGIFNFVDVGRGFFALSNLNSGKCLQVRGGVIANGAEVEQVTCGAAGDQDAFYVAGSLSAAVNPCENEFCAFYYDEEDFEALAIARNEPYPINYDFQGGSPDASIGEDTFSIYYVGHFDFADAGDYVFTTTSDDGVRLLVDGVAVIDQYFDQAPATYTATVNLTAGVHKVEIYYYENGGGAVIAASWAKQ